MKKHTWLLIGFGALAYLWMKKSGGMSGLAKTGYRSGSNSATAAAKRAAAVESHFCALVSQWINAQQDAANPNLISRLQNQMYSLVQANPSLQSSPCMNQISAFNAEPGINAGYAMQVQQQVAESAQQQAALAQQQAALAQQATPYVPTQVYYPVQALSPFGV